MLLKRRLSLADYAADAVLPLGPVGYWRLGEGTGTSAKDEAGNLNLAYANATLGVLGLVFYDGNTCADLSGTLSKISAASVPAVFNPALDQTVTFWANFDDILILTSLFNDRVDVNNAIHFQLTTTGQLNSYWKVAGTNYSALGTAIGVISAGTTYHLCFVVSTAGTADIYVNGAAIAVLNTPTNVPGTPNNTFTIGARGDGVAAVNGRMDEVTFLNRALTAGEAKALYLSGTTGT